MSHDPTAAPTPSPASPSPYAPRRTPLVHIGGALGIASVVLGFLIFFTACAGFDAAVKLSLLPVLLGVPGLILVIVGGIFQKQAHVEDTHALAALFLTFFGILGGLLEMAAWLHWQLFY